MQTVTGVGLCCCKMDKNSDTAVKPRDAFVRD